MHVAQTEFDELARRREKLLEQVGMDREQLQERAREGTLAAPDFWVWREIRSVEFLMDDSPPDNDDVGGTGEPD